LCHHTITWLVGSLVWLVGWLVRWFGWLVGWFVGLSVCLFGSLVGLFVFNSTFSTTRLYHALQKLKFVKDLSFKKLKICCLGVVIKILIIFIIIDNMLLRMLIIFLSNLFIYSCAFG